MAEVRLNKDEMVRVHDRLTDISTQLDQSADIVRGSLSIIKKDVDSEGVSTILDNYDAKVDEIRVKLTERFTKIQEYLSDKISSYESTATKAAQALEELNSYLDKVNSVGGE